MRGKYVLANIRERMTWWSIIAVVGFIVYKFFYLLPFLLKKSLGDWNFYPLTVFDGYESVAWEKVFFCAETANLEEEKLSGFNWGVK